MAIDEVDEKSLEKTTDATVKEYKPESDDVKSSYAARVEELGSELKQRVSDYMEDKSRDSSSWGMLKDLRLSIHDGEVSLTRKPDAPRDAGTNAPADGKTDGSADYKVEKIEQGQSTEFRSTNGHTTRVEYDQNHKPAKIEIDGATYTKGDKGWLEDGGAEFANDVEVSPEGDVTFNHGDAGKSKSIFHPDGSFSLETETTNQDGIASRYRMDDGEITEVRQTDGLGWKKEENTWHVYKDGKDTGEAWNGSFDLDPEGKLVQQPGSLAEEIAKAANRERSQPAEQQKPKSYAEEMAEAAEHVKDLTGTLESQRVNQLIGQAGDPLREVLDLDGLQRFGKTDLGSTAVSGDGGDSGPNKSGANNIISDDELAGAQDTRQLWRAKLEGKSPEEVASIKAQYEEIYLGELETQEEALHREVKPAHDKLEKQIKDSPDLDQAAKDRMKKDMEAFEQRVASEKPPMDPAEVQKTYRNIGRLLEAKDQPDWPIESKDRAVLAEQVLHHAADPSSIDQGHHATCNAATIESRMFTRKPSEASEFITNIALDGTYSRNRMLNGPLEFNKESLRRHPADGEESKNPPADGERSYASQLFQAGAINVSHNMHNFEVRQSDGTVKVYPPGSVEYRQMDPTPGSKPPNETGEILVDAKTGEPIKDESGRPFTEPNLSERAMVNVYNEIAGANPPESGILLADADYLQGDDLALEGEQVTKFKNKEELQQALEKAQSEGKMPVILEVNSAQEPFFTDSGGGSAGGAGASHVVLVTKFDSATGEAKIDNQWGSAADRVVKIDELYRATQDDKQALKTLERECADAIRAGKPDYKKELELLRFKHNDHPPLVSDKEYDRQLAWLTKQAVHEARANNHGVLDKRMQTELLAAYSGVHESDKKNGTHRMDALEKKVFASVLAGIERGNVGPPVEIDNHYHSDQAEGDADKIYKALDGYNDEDTVYKTLQGKTPAELHQLREEFKAQHNMTLEEYLADQLNDDQYEKAMKIMYPQGGYWLPG